jgi:nucleoside-diphosphate-sugar epimerase
VVRIFVAGATGVIGRCLLPLLRHHDVFGMTRSRQQLVQELGAIPVVVNAYARDDLMHSVAEAAPEVVVNLLTDLAHRDFKANNRIRHQGAANLLEAAVAAGARRLVVESVDMNLPPDGDAAVAEMERSAREAPIDELILRFPMLWGPGTWHDAPDEEGTFMHVEEAARRVLDAIFAPE